MSITTQAWIAYLTEFLGLGLAFFVGLAIAWKQGDVGFTPGRPRRWLLILVGGYLAYAAAQGALQFGALP